MEDGPPKCAGAYDPRCWVCRNGERHPRKRKNKPEIADEELASTGECLLLWLLVRIALTILEIMVTALIG
jgi:hypothetical protein